MFFSIMLSKAFCCLALGDWILLIVSLGLPGGLLHDFHAVIGTIWGLGRIIKRLCRHSTPTIGTQTIKSNGEGYGNWDDVALLDPGRP